MGKKLEMRIPLGYILLAALTWFVLFLWTQLEPDGQNAGEQFSIALGAALRSLYIILGFLVFMLTSSALGFFLSQTPRRKKAFALSFALGLLLSAVFWVATR